MQLNTHLNNNSWGLHQSKLVNLPTKMMSFYAQADGIPKYIKMLKEAQQNLAWANLPMSDNQLLAIASTIVLTSEHFPHPTNKWEALPQA